jgi:transcriptional regulator with XRE-family HTH domain
MWNELRGRRRALGLTQQEIADALQCSKMAVSYAERGLVSGGRIVRDLAALLLRIEQAGHS